MDEGIKGPLSIKALNGTSAVRHGGSGALLEQEQAQNTRTSVAPVTQVLHNGYQTFIPFIVAALKLSWFMQRQPAEHTVKFLQVSGGALEYVLVSLIRRPRCS
jgi:hypothetical protein|mmetsp:Transcript_82838/g.138249  ORF Transcript_82838/g.138249 Transcript_82838/m.138249 type:complete len:103 (-) Transcript_82838:1321-1629(-)